MDDYYTMRESIWTNISNFYLRYYKYEQSEFFIILKLYLSNNYNEYSYVYTTPYIKVINYIRNKIEYDLTSGKTYCELQIMIDGVHRVFYLRLDYSDFKNYES